MPLTAEQRNDLRKKVLAGQQLSLDEAREVVADARAGRTVAVLAGEAKAAKGKSRKPAMSDDALNADLAGLGVP